MRGGARFIGAQPLVLETVHLPLEVAFDFRREVLQSARPSKQGSPFGGVRFNISAMALANASTCQFL